MKVYHLITIVLCGFLLCAATAAAQEQTTAPQTQASGTAQAAQDQKPTSAAPAVTPAPPPPAVDYLFPDLAPKALEHDGKYFWFRPIIAWVVDYTSFTQDDASLTQVRLQDNAAELRAGRLGATFRSKGKLKWDFYFTVDYQEKQTRQNATFQLYDLRLGIPLGPVKMLIGKQKETFAYELTGLSVLLPQQERILLPFYPSRTVGVNFMGHFAGGRMTWAAGAFNDWLEKSVSFGRGANDYVGRVTALAWESPDKTQYVHLGLGLRSGGSDEGLMRFAGRPESNVATKFTDTQVFAANRATELSLEALWAHGRFSVLGEQIGAWVDAPASGNPYFSGYYVAGSWVLTGESRRYNRLGGYAGGIIPRSRYGAVELVAKFSRVDLTDKGIDGGVLNKWHYGVNWWASAQWKIGFSYGNADLDKAGLTGNTKMFLTRGQWLW